MQTRMKARAIVASFAIMMFSAASTHAALSATGLAKIVQNPVGNMVSVFCSSASLGGLVKSKLMVMEGEE